MKLRLALLLALLALAACPAPDKRDVRFWNITSTGVEFGSCTDEAWFRDSFEPFDAGTSTYLIYEIAKDGKTASTLECDRVSLDYCKTPSNPVKWDVEGKQLTRSASFLSSIPDAGCSISETVSDTITDNGQTMDDALVDVISLVDEVSGACADLDAQVKQHATNGFGLEGCVVTSRLGGQLKTP